MITTLILASQLTVFCGEQRDFAELVMKAQKTGVTMARVLEKEAENPLNQAIAIMAYRRPEMGIPEFGKFVETMCLENTDETD